MKNIFTLIIMSLIFESCSFFSDEGNALFIAQHKIVKASLKDPDSMVGEDFKVIESFKYSAPVGGKTQNGTAWLVHGNVTAANSFGGKVKTGHCIAFWTANSAYGLNFVDRECSRDNPTPDELSIVKALFQWDEFYKKYQTK